MKTPPMTARATATPTRIRTMSRGVEILDDFLWGVEILEDFFGGGLHVIFRGAPQRFLLPTM